MEDLEFRIRQTIGDCAPGPESLKALAEALFDKGDVSESMRVLRDLTHEFPRYYRAHDLLISMYEDFGRHQEASLVYDAWAREVP